MLKLTSPELEKFLIQNPTLATPTPSGYIFPKSVTEEQAMYAKGFEEALEHLRQSEPPGSNDLAAANTLATLSTASVGPAGRNLEVHRSLPEPHRSLDVHKSLPEAQQQNPGIPLSVQASSHSRPASGASGSYDSETYQVPEGVKIKDEPDDHLSLSGSDYGSEGMKSPPMNTTGMSPIDMETQEKIKLDRKRQRNRLAASKCRKSSWTARGRGTDWRHQNVENQVGPQEAEEQTGGIKMEKIKLDRKRQRNRLAASKWRKSSWTARGKGTDRPHQNGENQVGPQEAKEQTDRIKMEKIKLDRKRQRNRQTASKWRKSSWTARGKGTD